MSVSNKPKEQGFKPGANTEDGNPKQEGMGQSGNHATGNPANDAISGNQNLRQGNMAHSNLHNQQSAATAAKATTHRDRSAGARADDSSRDNKKES